MRPIKPHPDTWAESRGEYGPPVWQFRFGPKGAGFVFEHRDGAVAHIHSDRDGYLELATWDPTNEHALPDSDALHETVNAFVEQMAATPTGQAMLKLVSVSQLAEMRPSVGRPREWSDHDLLALAREFLKHGDRWTPAHNKWARSLGLEPQQIRRLMRRAEAAGLVTIRKSAGPRSPNVYSLTGLEPERVEANARAEWHRRSWREHGRKRRALQAHWERQHKEP
jgi:hypothetical protein